MDFCHRARVSSGPSRRGWCALILFALSHAMLGAAPAWMQVVGEGYVVLTPDTPSEAVAAAEEFRQFKFALDSMLTVDAKHLSPLTLVILRHPGTFKPYRPRIAGGKPTDAAGFFSRNLDWSVAALAERWGDGEGKRVMQHEAVHWFLSGTDFDRPVWFDEGMAEVFSTYGRRKGESMWGEPIPEHVELLFREEPLPIERLLNIKASDALYNEASRAGRFYATSWLFVHYLLYGQHDIPRQAIDTFLTAELRPGKRQASFLKAFGLDYAGMDAALHTYLHKGRFSYYAARSKEAAPLKATPADPLVVATALAKVSLAGSNPDQAARHLEEVRRLAPDSVIVDELAGYLARERGDYVAMRAAFARAGEKNSHDAGVYYWAAVSGVATAPPSAGGAPDEMPLTADLERMADLQLKVLGLRPDLQDSYDELARLSMALARDRPDDRTVLVEGFRRFPTSIRIAAALAFIDFRAGETKPALTLMRSVLRVATARNDTQMARVARQAIGDWEFQASYQKVKDALEAQNVVAAREEFARMSETAPSSRRVELVRLLRHIESVEATTAPTAPPPPAAGAEEPAK